LWAASLEGYGNVAYRGTVHPSAIKRAAPDFAACSGNNALFVLHGDYLLAAYPVIKGKPTDFRDRLLAEAS
jgi:hypothetical protein